MTITYSAKRALGRAIPSISPGVNTTKYGFPIQIDSPHESWKKVLEDIMPKFQEVGWLDGMVSMKISNDCVIGDDNIGNYTERTISIEHDAVHYEGVGYSVLELSKKSILIHEMVHHAHLHHVGFSNKDGTLTDEEEKHLSKYVSVYSTSNQIEAVAEIGAGIVMGYQFPDCVHDIYEKYDGPTKAYDIQQVR